MRQRGVSSKSKTGKISNLTKEFQGLVINNALQLDAVGKRSQFAFFAQNFGCFVKALTALGRAAEQRVDGFGIA